MKIEDFEFLKELSKKGVIVLTPDKNYAEAIYESNIPFRPGVYLVYSLNKEGLDKDLLYYGKAGVTNNLGTPHLNFHQLPKRIVATTQMPVGCLGYDASNKKDITRAKLWPWFVKNKYKFGINIYWFITEWPIQNPN